MTHKPQPKRSSYALRRLLAHFVPFSHLQQAPHSGTVEELRIATADGINLAATLLPRRRRSLVIVCHGFGSNQYASSIVWLAEQLAGPYDVLTFDWRGYGLSEGFASLGGAEALDLAAVLAAARGMGYRYVAVVAESMGGLITLATLGAAAADPAFPMPNAVATLAAPADYELTAGLRPQLVKYVAPTPWLRPVAPLLGFRLGEVQLPRPLDVVAAIPGPLLITHGDRDNTVPVRSAYLLNERRPASTLRIYPGVDHAIIGMRAKAPRVLLQDLRELLHRMG
ncbi:MAG: alpha/beta hydrolase [Oscillochloridaceae bacterium umkhey_bin13]